MTSATDAMARAARGIFLGAAVGDALGWPQEIRGGIAGGQKERDRATPRLEFRSWTRHAGHYSSRYPDPVRAGEYSDDTQLLLATARSCLAGDRWWDWLTEVEFPAWPLYQRGGGGAVLTAAASWAAGRAPWRGDGPARVQAVQKRYRSAGANGVAMRIAPHVLWADDSDDLLRRIARDGLTTHGHPRALVGALVYAFALRHAASSRSTHGFGDSVEAAAAGLFDVARVLPALPPDWGTEHDVDLFAATWQDTNKEILQLLEVVAGSLHRGAMSNPEATLERLGCMDPKINGSGTVSATAAIYLASRFAARPQSGLLSAAFLRKADTDTLASLTASILGALHETDWLGNLAVDVQDAGYIAGIAERTATRVTVPRPWPTQRPHLLRRKLTETLLSRRDTHGEFPDGRQYRLDEAAVLQDGHTIRAQLRLNDGQTVFIDLHADTPAGSGRSSRHREDQSSGDLQRASGPYRPDRDRTITGLEQSNPASTASARLAFAQIGAGVVLAAHSLARSAAFYAQLTGRNIPVRGGTAEITTGVAIRQSDTDTQVEASTVIVNITVDDLPAATRRLGLETAATATNNHLATIEVCDPDGRTVRVSERRPTQPDR